MANNPIYIDVEQGSPEWHSIRCGLPSASKFNSVVTSTGAASRQIKKYLYQLAGERLLGFSPDGYQSDAMLRGQELEAEARESYEFITEDEVQQVGFCFKDERKRYGCSPDGIIGEKGGLEIKCPTLPVAVEYLDKGVLPTTYVQQVQGSMLVTGRKWWDFMSYYPGLSPLILRVERDEKFIALLESQLSVFCEQLEDMTRRLKG